MIDIYFLFIWKYAKEHKSRLFLSLMGIAFGISLFFTTQTNAWRAEESLIDAQLGYPNNDYIGQFVLQNGNESRDSSILKKLYFLIPENFIIDVILTKEAFINNSELSLIHFPLIGKDILLLNTTNHTQSGKTKKKVPTYFITNALFDQIFKFNSSVKINLCEKEVNIFKEDSIKIQRDGKFILTDIQILQGLCDSKDQIQKILIQNISNEQFTTIMQDNMTNLGKDFGWEWESIEDIRERSGKALGSLKINLTIVSLVSVLISFFMVANTFSGIYLSRRKEFGILSCIGNDRLQNLFLFLSQSLLLGFLGSLLGIVIGYALLQLNIFNGNNTLTDSEQISTYTKIPIQIYFFSISIGIFGSLFSALTSSLKSYFIKPIDLVREKELEETNIKFYSYSFFHFAIFGIVLTLIGIGIGFIPSPKSLIPGLTGVGFVLLGFILIFPYFLVSTVRFSLRVFDRYFFFPTFKIAWEEIQKEPIQNTLTAATILLSSSLVITLTTLTESYKYSLIKWVNEESQFDYSIINPNKLSSGLPGVPNQLLLELTKRNELEKIEPFIIQSKFLIDKNYFTLNVYPFESNDKEIYVSSNYCYLEKKCKGDTLQILTEKFGKMDFSIKGEKEHFFSERGTIMMSYHVFQKYFSHSDLNSIRLKFNPMIPKENWSIILNSILKKDFKELKILDENALKDLYLEGMNSVFSVLDSLKICAIAISLLALLTSLIYNIREKSKLIATLRAIGLSKYQLYKILFFQSLFLILIGLLLGVGNSLVLSPIVIYGINRNAFGWILDFHYPYEQIGYFLLFVPILATIVSFYPFLKAAKISLRESLNYE
ncbi:MAG: FtsX-like permease family protein [Leptospira sp.]|nr:FtsX-like permease family protein [Leptospira sp.]